MDFPNAAVRAALAEVKQLRLDANKMFERGRYERTEELFSRSLATAEAAQPPDSLVIVSSLANIISRIGFFDTVAGSTPCEQADKLMEMWRTDPRRLEHCRRSLRILDSRWRAGSLFKPTSAELWFFDTLELDVPACNAGGFFMVLCARQAAWFWPALQTPADEDERLHLMHNALQVAVELDARIDASSRSSSYVDHAAYRIAPNAIEDLLRGLLLNHELLTRLRSVCGLSRSDEAAARRLLHKLKQAAEAGDALAGLSGDPKARKARAAADVARFGLLNCALATCGALEAHVKHFKRCGRCKGVVYCCREHQAQDWPNHKSACAAACIKAAGC